jgi:hypothetical protein
MAVSFNNGANTATRRKASICRKSLTNYHIMLYQVHLIWEEFELIALVVICTDCIGSCKSNYYAITTTTAPIVYWVVDVAKMYI